MADLLNVFCISCQTSPNKSTLHVRVFEHVRHQGALTSSARSMYSEVRGYFFEISLIPLNCHCCSLWFAIPMYCPGVLRIAGDMMFFVISAYTKSRERPVRSSRPKWWNCCFPAYHVFTDVGDIIRFLYGSYLMNEHLVIIPQRSCDRQNITCFHLRIYPA